MKLARLLLIRLMDVSDVLGSHLYKAAAACTALEGQTNSAFFFAGFNTPDTPRSSRILSV